MGRESVCSAPAGKKGVRSEAEDGWPRSVSMESMSVRFMMPSASRSRI